MAPNSSSARQQKIAHNLQNMKPFKGTLNADWEELPEGHPDAPGSHYVVRSYDTPIARAQRNLDSGHFVRSLSTQQFTRTTSNHQAIVRQHLPGEEGEPLGEQSWTRRPWGYVPGRSEGRTLYQPPAEARAARLGALWGEAARGGRPMRPQEHYSPDQGGGARIQDLFSNPPNLFTDRRSPARPSRHIDRVLDLEP